MLGTKEKLAGTSSACDIIIAFFDARDLERPTCYFYLAPIFLT